MHNDFICMEEPAIPLWGKPKYKLVVVDSESTNEIRQKGWIAEVRSDKMSPRLSEGKLPKTRLHQKHEEDEDEEKEKVIKI